MTAARAAPFAVYAAHGGIGPDWREFPFWAACAVVSSCAQRRLRALLDAVRAGVQGEQLALHG